MVRLLLEGSLEVLIVKIKLQLPHKITLVILEGTMKQTMKFLN